jgi:hypothetical protein
MEAILQEVADDSSIIISKFKYNLVVGAVTYEGRIERGQGKQF